MCTCVHEVTLSRHVSGVAALKGDHGVLPWPLSGLVTTEQWGQVGAGASRSTSSVEILR